MTFHLLTKNVLSLIIKSKQRREEYSVKMLKRVPEVVRRNAEVQKNMVY